MQAVALLWACLVGWLAIRVSGVTRGFTPRWAALLFEIALGAGAGVAITAGLYMALLIAGVAQRWTVVAAEVVLTAVGTVLAWRSRRAHTVSDQTKPIARWRWSTILAGVVAVLFLIILLAQVDSAKSQPYGEFDAFAMWSARARFLLGPGDTWQRAVSPMLENQRPDHPLLLSAFLARTWRWSGDETQGIVPAATSALFFWAAWGVLFGSLAILRGPPAALLATIVLVPDISLLEQSTWHYADIPIALYFLGCLTLLLLGMRTESGSRRTTLLVVSGVFASFAVLTKNEGIPFLMAVPAVLALVEWRNSGLSTAWRSVGPWIAGVAPGAALEAYFKIAVAPASNPPSTSQALDFMMQPERYGTILSHLFSTALDMGHGIVHPLLLIAILGAVFRFDLPKRLRPYLMVVGAVLVVELLSYCAVYLTTPDDLVWRLGTSLGRLYTQLWPALVLLVFLVVRSPRDRVETEESEEGTKGKRKRKKRRQPDCAVRVSLSFSHSASSDST